MTGNVMRPTRSRREMAALHDHIALVAVVALMVGVLGTSAWLFG